MTEKEIIKKILTERNIIKEDNTIDSIRFKKLVTEPWVHQRVISYGWLNNGVTDIEKIANKSSVIDDVQEPVELVNEEEKIAETPVISENMDIVDEPAPSIENIEEIIEEPEAVSEENATEEPMQQDKPIKKKKTKK